MRFVRICRQPECRQAFRSDLTVSIVTNTCRPSCDDMRHLWYQLIPRLSWWPRVLSRGSGASWLLGLWIRTPSGAWVSFSCKCCMLSGRYVCDGPIARPEESFRAWCVLSVLATSTMRRPRPTGAVEPWKIINCSLLTSTLRCWDITTPACSDTVFALHGFPADFDCTWCCSLGSDQQ